MEEFVLEINRMLQNILDSNSDAMQAMVGAARNVAFLGAFILSAIMAYGMFMGKSIDYSKITRIVLVMLGIIFYNSLVSFINAPLDAIVETTRVAAEKDGTLYEALENETREEGERVIENAKHEERLKTIAAENGWLDRAVSAVKTAPIGPGMIDFFDVMKLEKNIKDMLIDFFQWLLISLAKLALIILNVVRTFFLIVLTIFGIFSIAFSVYPGLENSFYSWLQKYINVYLWLAAGYILEGLLIRLTHGIKSIGTFTIASDGAQAYWDTGMYNAGLVLISLGSIIGMAMVPTITSWIISAQVSSAASKLKSKAQSGMQSLKAAKAGKMAAGAATGGKAAVASAVAGKMKGK